VGRRKWERARRLLCPVRAREVVEQHQEEVDEAPSPLPMSLHLRHLPTCPPPVVPQITVEWSPPTASLSCLADPIPRLPSPNKRSMITPPSPLLSIPSLLLIRVTLPLHRPMAMADLPAPPSARRPSFPLPLLATRIGQDVLSSTNSIRSIPPIMLALRRTTTLPLPLTLRPLLSLFAETPSWPTKMQVCDLFTEEPPSPPLPLPQGTRSWVAAVVSTAVCAEREEGRRQLEAAEEIERAIGEA
jgi:hypothetical protein